MPKIKIDKELYSKVKLYAEKAGYSSSEEFVTHLLEQIIQPSAEGDSDEDLIRKLQGLGYIA